MAKSVRLERARRRRGGLMSKARKLVAACVGGVFLLITSRQVSVEALGSPQEQTPQSFEAPVFKDHTATCKLSSVSGASASAQSHLTLSEDQLAVTLVCQGGGATAVPDGPQTVCQELSTKKERGTADDCTIAESITGTPVSLATVLAADSQAKWEKDTTTEGSSAVSRTLTIRNKDLPLTDTSFYVGCRKSTGDNASKCKVPVKVLARHSSAETNIVTCAYGANSNEFPVNVEITQERNTLTVVCGTEGSIHPQEYKTQFCEKEDLNACTKSYSEILPMFDEQWWAEEKDSSVKLTIPSTHFPTQDQSFYMGCSPTKSENEESQVSSARAAGDAGSDTALSTCKVLVTVKASGSSLSAGPRVGMVTAVSGAAVLTEIIAGSL
ncbi:SAG-related sequence [Besnoitia besnoiti]|uniref:SAG-related sequence n=1 Tax=Besnoitia besnoiti TaxID=94643 RepID=A0A2A9MI71_BESBE|nr:SAG-related sequence [Besnoitia besnoiti]PFH35656.1 SAG-related sequence [Besnoitia besnoiti]